MAIGSIYKLLDKLEMMVLKGIPIPFTPFVVVNHEKIIDVLDKVRACIPNEIQEAHGIIKRSEDIQMEAQRRAENILVEAKEKAERILSESELLKAVHAEADRVRGEVIAEAEAIRKRSMEEAEAIRAKSVAEATAIRDGSDRYAEQLLSNLEKNLSEMHTIVRNAQDHLSRTKVEPPISMNYAPQQQQMADFEDDDDEPVISYKRR
jgi:cell division septum initiation protein DivIVA